VESLKDGEVREREPARPNQQSSQQGQPRFTGRQYGQQAYGQGLRSQVRLCNCHLPVHRT